MKKEISKAGGYNRKESSKEEVLSSGLILLNNSVLKGVSTPSTLMPTGMGATNPKFAMSVRKLKKTEHYNFPEMWQRKSSNNENYK